MLSRRSLITGLGIAPLALSLHRSSSAQAIVKGKAFKAYASRQQTGLYGGGYNQVAYEGVRYNHGWYYDPAQSIAIPPGGPGLVRLGAGVMLRGGGGIPGNPFAAIYCLKLVKNWPAQDVGTSPPGMGYDANQPGNGAMALTTEDEYRPGDFYWVQVRVDPASPPFPDGYFEAQTPGTFDLDDNFAHQQFWGEIIG